MSPLLIERPEPIADAPPKIRLNKSLRTACDELIRIGKSLQNDKRIKATYKGVNAINRELHTDIDLHAIRKLKFDEFRDNYERPIDPAYVGNTLIRLGETIKNGGRIYWHIGDLADAERALNIRLTSHLMNKSSFISFMRKNNIKFKQGYSLDRPNRIYWGKSDQYEKCFYFPFEYRPMTTAELERQTRQAERNKKSGAKKAQITRKRNAKLEKKRKKSAQKIIDNIAKNVDDYIKNNDTDIPLFFDTETTGLGSKDEVIELAVIDLNGVVIIDTLIYTKRRIDWGAYEVNGIEQSKLDGMPKFSEIEQYVNKLFEDRQVWAFNAHFDVDKIYHSSSKDFEFNAKSIDCLMYLAMEKFNKRHYISLASVCRKLGVARGSHRAKSDTLASIAVYKTLTAK